MSSLKPARSVINLTGWSPPTDYIAKGEPLFDTLTSTAEDLRRELQQQRITSVQIIREYYRSIVQFNGYLNAIYELAPGALAEAERLDNLRADGVVLGAFHGIPILLKDNIATDASLGLGTCAGGIALIGSVPKKNASIVEKLVDAGAIILGKATMSEYGDFKSMTNRSGWSAAAGQAQNPYVTGGDDPQDGLGGHSSTGGSSSGSAVAVTAGLSPISIGTETQGSLIVPAVRAALYTIKVGQGIIPGDGIFPISHRFDTAGPMAKSVKDIADLLTVLVDSHSTTVPEGGYSSAMCGSDGWKDLTIGTLDPDDWLASEMMIKPVAEATAQIKHETLSAYKIIQGLAKSYHQKVPLPSAESFNINGEDAFLNILLGDFPSDCNRYLAGLESSRVRSLQELVEWNRANGAVALPHGCDSQDILEHALKSKYTDEEFSKFLNHVQSIGTKFDDVFERYGLDVVIGPTDCLLGMFSAVKAAPIVNLPLAYLDYNGRPISLLAAAPRHKEATLIKLMSAFEATFPPRKPPAAFRQRIV
ncbi:hypothetical protein PMG11_11110 [Penicillium brasilianum]|uniref:Amidase domain-containing protein n=1 Tax=Penicillium brasilianum TaxID=104259 RepID=A0A0F7U178_PENBI|nr:hypothetical protein PMG11_11110 [Penicillium brasilianum]